MPARLARYTLIVRGRRDGLRLTCAAALALLTWTVPAAAQGPALISIAPVEQRPELASGQVFVGSVMAPRRSAVGSAVDGRVIEMLVEAGDRVAADQPIAQLRTQTLEIEIAAAEAELELRRQELNELENGSRPEEIREAEGRMLAAQAAMEYAKQRLDRTRVLVERNATSQNELQDHISQAVAAANLYEAARATYDLAMAGPRNEKILQARARVSAAQETVNRLSDMLEKHTIRSPFDGWVVAEHTEVGQWIQQAALVADIVEINPVEIEAQVPEAYLPHLALGASARVELDALGDRIFEGQITALVPLGDVRSRSFPVKVQLPNEMREDGTPLLKPGMFARVWLPVDKRGDVLVVPKDAIVLGGLDRKLFVYQPASAQQPDQGTVRVVQVEMGIASDGMVEVRGQLKAGELVVVEGNERLMPGQQVVVTRRQPPTGPKAPSTAAR